MIDHNQRIKLKKRGIVEMLKRYFKYRRVGFGRKSSFWLAVNGS